MARVGVEYTFASAKSRHLAYKSITVHLKASEQRPLAHLLVPEEVMFVRVQNLEFGPLVAAKL